MGAELNKGVAEDDSGAKPYLGQDDDTQARKMANEGHWLEGKS